MGMYPRPSSAEALARLYLLENCTFQHVHYLGHQHVIKLNKFPTFSFKYGDRQGIPEGLTILKWKESALRIRELCTVGQYRGLISWETKTDMIIDKYEVRYVTE